MGDNQFALIKYFHSAKSREPIYRVEPCLIASINKLEAVRQCCESVALSDSKKSTEGEALMGCVSVLGDIKDELYDATELLHGVS